MRIGLDLRWLQQAYKNSPAGGLGGIGTVCRGLWLGLARAFPETELVALVSRATVPQPLLNLIRAAPRHEIQPFGLSGLLPFLDGKGRYTLILRLLETELWPAAWLDKLKLDALHLLDHTPPPRWATFPTIVTVHDLIGLKKNTLFYKHFLNLERANQLVPVSRSTQADLALLFPQRAGRLPVIYSGIDTDMFKRPKHTVNHLRKRFSIDGDYFMHVGVLTDRKNPIGLIKAMRRVVELRQEKIMLLCVGPYQVNPSARESVLELAREYGIQNHVLMLGDVGAEELSSLYYHALGLVFPSFAEGFGLPALECLACGTPCVVSQTTSLPEVVGDWGILVDPHSDEEIADGMLRLLNDEPYRAKIREQGPAWAQRFSFEAMAQKYMEIYQGLALRSHDE